MEFSEEVLYPSVACGMLESPIDNVKLETCYHPNGNMYPLCKGEKNNPLCKDCNVYEEDSDC